MIDYYEETPTRPTRTPPPPPPREIVSRSSPNFLSLIVIGIVIVLIGGIIIISFGFINDPDDEEYSSDNYSNYEKDLEEYMDMYRMVSALGSLVQYVGLIILSIGLIYGAVRAEYLPPNVRLGMLLAMGLIVGLKLGGLFIPYFI
jgi:hypothetical protein